MRASSRRANLLLAFAVALIVGTLALYASLLYSWLRGPLPAPSGQQAAAQKADPRQLAQARQGFRDAFLDPRSWMTLSQALYQAGRPIDAFYVMQGARELFGDRAFLRAHEEVVLKRGQDLPPDVADDEQALRNRLQSDPADPAAVQALSRLYARTGRGGEAQQALDLALAAHPDNGALLLAKARLTSLTDVMQAIPFYARAANADPASYDGQRALEELGKLAAAREDGPQADQARLAQQALDELRKAHPKDPGVFSTLAFALWARGDLSMVRAMAVEEDRQHPHNAGAAAVDGALALQDHDPELALRRFTAAWEASPEDLYSAEKLAQIYDQQRGDPESALPYYIALYRRDPLRQEGPAPLEELIRRILDTRRRQVLSDVPAEGLGRFLQSDDASLRAEACVRAAQLKDPRWIDVLANLLDDDTEIVRHNADYALYQIAKAYPDAVQVRRDDWLANDRPLMRARVLNLFADLWPDPTWPLVKRALYDQNPALRYLVKTMILDSGYYKGVDEVARVKAEYLAQEKNPLVLAQYDADRRHELAAESAQRGAK